jgi:LuxR family maltose regulon positive regulatory protein
MLALDQALATARQLGSPAYTQRVCAEQARLALAQDDRGLAQRWQLEVARDLGVQLDTTCETEALILARVLMEPWRQAPGDPALNTAHTILARLREDAAAHGRTGSLIEILALLALVDAAMGQRDQALVELQQALLLAMPEGYARIFLDEGAPMRLLLADCRWQIAQSNHGTNREVSQLLLAYVERLLAAFPTSTSCSSSQPATSDRQSAPLVEPLSERELEVLRLIAGGASNQAIAVALVISIGTVKSHINHILGKLAACNRTEAVSLGRALGLLAE